MARFPEAEARLLHVKICMKCNARNACAHHPAASAYKGLRPRMLSARVLDHRIPSNGIYMPLALLLRIVELLQAIGIPTADISV